MADLVLARSADDRRRYDIAGVGSLRRMGLFSRTTLLLPLDGEPLTARSRGLLAGEAEAVAPGGEVVGELTHRALVGHGGEISWRGRSLRLTSGTVLTSHFTLHDGETTLFDVRAKGWGVTPAEVTLHGEPVEPGLLLFVLWLVQGFVDQDSGASGAASGAAVG